jgi:hypothetical protein
MASVRLVLPPVGHRKAELRVGLSPACLACDAIAELSWFWEMAMVPSKGKKIGMRRLLMFLLGLALS